MTKRLVVLLAVPLFHLQLFAAVTTVEGLILDKRADGLLILEVNSYETVQVPISVSTRIQRANHDGIVFDDLRIGWFVEITQEEGQPASEVRVKTDRFGDVELDAFQESSEREGVLIVDGQIVLIENARFMLNGSVDMVDPGLITKVKGVRLDDGSVEAEEIEVALNDIGHLERDVLRANVRGLREFNRRLDLLEEDDELQEYVERVAARLIPRLAQEAIDFKFHVIQDPTLNAFAARAFSTLAEDRMLGSIYVHTGLLKVLQNESQLAAVLGHEIAHITHEHSTRGLTRSIWTNILAGIAANVVKEATSGVWGVLAETGITMAHSAIVNGYGRDFEDQADRVGLRYLHNAGYDPLEAPKVWDIFAKELGDQDAATNFFYGNHSTHNARKRNLFLEISRNYFDSVNCDDACGLTVNEDVYKLNVLNRLENPPDSPKPVLSGVLFLPYRTDSHRSSSDVDVYLRTIDGVLQHLESNDVSLLDDDFFKHHFNDDPRFDRLIALTQSEEPRIDTVLSIANSLGADSLFLLRIDRPLTQWIKIEAACYDLSGELLWQVEVSEGGWSSRGHVEKAVLKVSEEFDKRLGEDCLTSMENTIASARDTLDRNLRPPDDAPVGVVKKSASGICHCPGGQFYDRTTNFTEYETIDACVASGGREPLRGQGNCPMASSSDDSASMRVPDRYDRSAFGGWGDEDGDCQNTRHERLIARSAEPVELSQDGCQVLRGRWRDPYTGNIHVSATEIEIDHVVPLFYAWERGANRWEAETQRRFANDSANLLPVGAMVNRSKGAAGPLEWLPPSEAFACEYLLRFDRVADRYDLNIRSEETTALEQLTAQKCD